MTEDHKNKLKNQPHARHVVQLTNTGRFVRLHKSVSEASRQTGISRTAITNALNKKSGIQLSGGFVWKYLSEFSDLL